MVITLLTNFGVHVRRFGNDKTNHKYQTVWKNNPIKEPGLLIT